MVRKYFNHTYLRHSLTYKTKCNILSYSFLKKWVAPKRAGLVVKLPQRQNLGAGASTGAATTGRASHSPLFYSYSSSHWDVEGWMVCLCIPILRRMRCGGRIIPPIFLLVTDSLHLHFHFRIINQIFDPSTHLQHLLMILYHLQKKFTCILYSIHCLQQPLVASTIVLPCFSNCPKRKSKLQAISLLLFNTKTKYKFDF